VSTSPGVSFRDFELVDAFYPSLPRVVEYRARQHSEAVPSGDWRGDRHGAERGLGDLRSGVPKGWLVAGYFTPDYRHWTTPLIASLEAHGAPYHLFAWPACPLGRDATTRLKPQAILRAMDQYPTQTIIWLDVDCEIAGDLLPLTATRADLAARAVLKHPDRRRAKQQRRWLVIWRTGTLVIRPTPQARAFVEAWAERCATAQGDANDQDGFLEALTNASDITLEPLAAKWCARVGEGIAGTVVRHAGGPRGSVAAREKRQREQGDGCKRHRTISMLLRKMEKLCAGTINAASSAPPRSIPSSGASRSAARSCVRSWSSLRLSYWLGA
jgi:Nucleotide-diphospho-sugar transferase